ncbi:hypothetical protein NQ314_004359 [Rhamnusium bicolor]|uniref:Niemann-Pick C1 N-terminal domain-containing protein n=1 Tax=Rhamnusium bicolor TaxID=1586634 RepID=A0AAV8ZLC4_9CUCU|nr:hypothetical protein NQ314_004359 [Rhamnusium bicolor]
MATLDMIVKNTGITPTFSRGNCESFIDVTFSTQRITANIVRWEVLDEESLSDQRFIYFEVERTTRNRGNEGKTVIRHDWEVFRTIVEWTTEGMEVNKSETTAETCTRVLKDAYTDSQIRRCRGRRAEVPYWWNTKIEVQRTKCLEKRRQLTRANRNNGGRANSAELNEEYRRCKRELKNLIDRSKRKHWRELCDDLENNIWGNGYRIAMFRLANQMPTQLSTERKKEIAAKLRYRTMLEGVQRRMLLRVGSAYRTTSTVALQVITGVIPIDLMVEERRYLHEMGNGQELAIRKAARERTLNLWQRRWELNEEKGQWTKRLIPDLRPWVTCRHRRVDFYISQFLTAHGSFGVYTQRLGIKHRLLDFYEESDESSRAIKSSILNPLQQLQLDIGNVTAFGANNASVNYGKHCSMYQKLSEVKPKIMKANCNCGKLHNAAEHYLKLLSFESRCTYEIMFGLRDKLKKRKDLFFGFKTNQALVNFKSNLKLKCEEETVQVYNLERTHSRVNEIILIASHIGMGLQDADGDSHYEELSLLQKASPSFINQDISALAATNNDSSSRTDGTTAGHCIWYGECNGSGAKKQNCLYNGTALPLNGTGPALLKTWCPDLSPGATCCSEDQLQSFDTSIKMAANFLKRCPSCMANLVRHLCSMTCSPDQSKFIDVKGTAVNAKTNKTYITAIDVYLSEEYLQGTYNSCKQVSVPSTGFGSPRVDVCSTCLELTEKIKAANDKKKVQLMTIKRVHSLKAKSFFNFLQEEGDVLLTMSFDCQKNMSLPKLPDQKAYFSRQWSFYNFTIVVGGSHTPLTKNNRTIKRNITIRGEEAYRSDLGSGKLVTKKGMMISNLVPGLLTIGMTPNVKKIADVAALLQAHYGQNWRSLEKLSLYVDIEKSEATNAEDDLACEVIVERENIV